MGDEMPTGDEGESPQEERPRIRKRRRVLRKPKEVDPALLETFEFPGVVKAIISKPAQEVLCCVLGKEITIQEPWTYVLKESMTEFLDTELARFKDKINAFPNDKILVGYIPDDDRDYDEYYVCLTEQCENQVQEVKNRIQDKREEQLNNSILRTPGRWKAHGSDREMVNLLFRTRRNLLIVEVESCYPVMTKRRHLKIRSVESVQDGYLELTSPRVTFYNVVKRRIDAAVQVTSRVVENESQTFCGYPKNAITQYAFTAKMAPMNEKKQARFVDFVTSRADQMDDWIYVNGYVDPYTTDYEDLVLDEKWAKVPIPTLASLYTAFFEIRKFTPKQVTSISFHPMWTGTFAVAYSEYAQSVCKSKRARQTDEVNEAVYNIMPVLMWSMKNNLEPRLLLETPREVSSVAFCPFDENIIVGGCVNGQVLLWDITDKLDNVEREEILTTNQRAYRLKIKSLMTWMTNIKDLKRVRPTVVSQLEFSHTSLVTSINWLHPLREISKTGKVSDIPEAEERTSMQFLSTSKDGTMLIWDLLAKQKITGAAKPKKKFKRLKEKPAALAMQTSPYSELNRILKPIFQITIYAPNSFRPLALMQVDAHSRKPIYIEVNPNPNRKKLQTDRIHYRAVNVPSTLPLVNKVVVGSAEGDLIVASWEGFDFNSGDIVNRENAKVEVAIKFHDGPILSLARSSANENLILTVGGNVFALWNLSFPHKPVFWRRARVRYTHGVFNLFRPSIFRISRIDGYIEFWHLQTRSDRYIYLEPFSGSGITASYTHALPLPRNVFAITDVIGALVFYFMAPIIDSKSMSYDVCKRESNRKDKIAKWQDLWNSQHEDIVRAKMEKDHELMKSIFAVRNKKKQATTTETVVQAPTVSKGKDDPGTFSERMHEKYMKKETERMIHLSLSKKFIDMEALEEMVIPLKQLEEEAKKKADKHLTRLSEADKLFQDGLALHFPEAVKEKPVEVPDPYAGGDRMNNRREFVKHYHDIEKECSDYITKNPHIYRFDWHKIKKSGLERRQVISDYYYGKRKPIRSFAVPLPPKVEIPDEDVQEGENESNAEAQT